MIGPKDRSTDTGPATPEISRVVLDRSPPHGLRTHVRATVIVVVLVVVIGGLVYPAVVTGIAQLLTPGSANGSLIYENGTVVGSELVGQNISSLNLFWERPSMNDYNTTVGYEEPNGSTDPGLLAYLNVTIAYMIQDWNWSMNVTLPFDLISPSYSGFDPYVAPAGLLIQVSRVAGAIHNATQGSFDDLVTNLTALVNQHIEQPIGGIIGTAVVNVVSLDVALIESPWWG